MTFVVGENASTGAPEHCKSTAQALHVIGDSTVTTQWIAGDESNPVTPATGADVFSSWIDVSGIDWTHSAILTICDAITATPTLQYYVWFNWQASDTDAMVVTTPYLSDAISVGEVHPISLNNILNMSSLVGTASLLRYTWAPYIKIRYQCTGAGADADIRSVLVGRP